ncbi:hypothetical protein K439DRAFT_493467 [Ramaria rubella]|nr:hypothetical protein K439DRAFT_493467 [Ramaria rubella]
MGEHLDTQPATCAQLKAICANMERKFCEQLRSSQSMPPAVYRQGEHLTPVRAPLTAISSLVAAPHKMLNDTQVPELSPPVGLCIPRVRSNIPKEKRWLAFVKDWEEPDVTRGLIIPLKDWNPKWKTDLNFAMSYTARRVIATEFIDKYVPDHPAFCTDLPSFQLWPAGRHICAEMASRHERNNRTLQGHSSSAYPRRNCKSSQEQKRLTRRALPWSREYSARQ